MFLRRIARLLWSPPCPAIIAEDKRLTSFSRLKLAGGTRLVSSYLPKHLFQHLAYIFTPKLHPMRLRFCIRNSWYIIYKSGPGKTEIIIESQTKRVKKNVNMQTAFLYLLNEIETNPFPIPLTHTHTHSSQESIQISILIKIKSWPFFNLHSILPSPCSLIHGCWIPNAFMLIYLEPSVEDETEKDCWLDAVLICEGKSACHRNLISCWI